MSTRIEREYKAMLAPDRVVRMRNQEGLEVQVRILGDYPDRYVVGHPEPAKNGPEICRMLKSEWRIIPAREDLLYVAVALGAFLGLLASGIYIYLNTH